LEYSSIKSFYVCQKSTFSENDLLFKRAFEGRPAGNGKIANDSNSTDPAAPDSRSARTNRLVMDHSPWITRAALHLPHHPRSRGATRPAISDFLRGCGPSFPTRQQSQKISLARQAASCTRREGDTIGRGSTIGGNVWLTQHVPPNNIVTQATARNKPATPS
jgi:hypothetical protein